MEKAAVQFKKAATEVSVLMEVYKCIVEEEQEGHSLDQDWFIPACLAFDLFILLLCVLCLRRPKQKVKMN